MPWTGSYEYDTPPPPQYDYEEQLRYEAYMDYLDHRAYLDYLEDLVYELVHPAPAYVKDAPQVSRMLMELALLCALLLLVLAISWAGQRSAQRVPATPRQGADLRRRNKGGRRWQQAGSDAVLLLLALLRRRTVLTARHLVQEHVWSGLSSSPQPRGLCIDCLYGLSCRAQQAG